MAKYPNHMHTRDNSWKNPKILLPCLLLFALVGGYYVYATNAAADKRPLLVDRDGRDNHAGVKVSACSDSSVAGDKLRVKLVVTRPDEPKYNAQALSSNVTYGKITSRSVDGWTNNSQTYFVNADEQDRVEVNVMFSNDYQEVYPYIEHEDGRIAPARADQLDAC